jgi:hypothetical protein
MAYIDESLIVIRVVPGPRKLPETSSLRMLLIERLPPILSLIHRLREIAVYFRRGNNAVRLWIAES